MMRNGERQEGLGGGQSHPQPLLLPSTGSTNHRSSFKPFCGQTTDITDTYQHCHVVLFACRETETGTAFTTAFYEIKGRTI